MKQLWVFAIFFAALLMITPAFGMPASKFASIYGDELSKGLRIQVLVTVVGEPISEDPVIRAKEIRNLQAAPLKFSHFAGATNVVSDRWDNFFTAEVTVSLAQVLEQRRDVISVEVLDAFIQLPPELRDNYSEKNIKDIPVWVQETIMWYNEGKISQRELVNAIDFVLRTVQ